MPADSSDRSAIENSMSPTLIFIGSAVGHFAAAVYSLLARGPRVLHAPARAGKPRSGVSFAPQALAGSRLTSRGA